ncbi:MULTISPECIES: BglG family transcription antiterminator LicT [Saccharibacillus]|uniref:PRD domain-containing protein n=1 Tax=Saccharibacillus brassicae TaxID=2583377 RepID=A0A4Y6UV66_SACBS|nr:MULTISPECIES: PRD domain-containing protein [Saccharibacillus]MWJ31193.1 PRD domain-containing protein [Saccharibacillus sp. WB 17]QDH20468.1 PRD domain-containing protein [Saccharibacillus brassicae]
MQILRVLNNNVITSLDGSEIEIVVMGRGLAFQKKPGDEVDADKIEKVFRPESNDSSRKLKELLEQIPMEYVQLTEEIRKLAALMLDKEFGDSIYLSLTDHIHFAVERQRRGLEIKNGLLLEVKSLYKAEYQVGRSALKLIKERIGVELPDDEAAFIAMHLVNAQLGEEMPVLMNITKIMQDILDLVRTHFDLEYDVDSISYYRFVTHLKFFAQRLISGDHSGNNYDSLYEIVKENCPEAYPCTERIEAYIAEHYDYRLNKEEMLYLTIHIDRIAKA